MTTDVVGRRPYRPSFIHAFYAWLDRLPIPAWLTFLLVFPIIGIVQHLVAWRKGLLAQGQFNFDLATAGYWVVGILLIGIYVMKGAARALDEFRPVLEVSAEEYGRLKYQFVTIPSGWGSVFFLMGLALGAMTGFSDMAIAPAVDYAFPELRIGIWMLTTGIGLPFVYQVIRQLRQIRTLYAMPKQIDLFNLRPLYGFPRYTAVLGIMVFLYEALIPLALDRTAFASRLVLTTSIIPILLVLLMFHLPLSGVHRRLAAEKERLLEEVNSRISAILQRIHTAAFEQQDYEAIGGMRAVYSTLREEKETVQGLRTWPWRPGTLTGLLSALFLPILLGLVTDLLSRLLG